MGILDTIVKLHEALFVMLLLWQSFDVYISLEQFCTLAVLSETFSRTVEACFKLWALFAHLLWVLHSSSSLRSWCGFLSLDCTRLCKDPFLFCCVANVYFGAGPVGCSLMSRWAYSYEKNKSFFLKIALNWHTLMASAFRHTSIFCVAVTRSVWYVDTLDVSIKMSVLFAKKGCQQQVKERHLS